MKAGIAKGVMVLRNDVITNKADAPISSKILNVQILNAKILNAKILNAHMKNRNNKIT